MCCSSRGDCRRKFFDGDAVFWHTRTFQLYGSGDRNNNYRWWYSAGIKAKGNNEDKKKNEDNEKESKTEKSIEEVIHQKTSKKEKNNYQNQEEW